MPGSLLDRIRLVLAKIRRYVQIFIRSPLQSGSATGEQADKGAGSLLYERHGARVLLEWGSQPVNLGLAAMSRHCLDWSTLSTAVATVWPMLQSFIHFERHAPILMMKQLNSILYDIRRSDSGLSAQCISVSFCP